MTQTIEQKYKKYLNELRRKGSVNMFGAAPYLARAFGLQKGLARDILAQWMKEFDPEVDS